MKIAICFSGQIRTGIQAAPNIKRFIGDLWDDCDFFIHTWDISRTKPTPAQVKEHGGFYIGDEHDIDVNQFKEIYNFTAASITTQSAFGGSSWLWRSWLYSIQLKQKHEVKNNMKYDYVVKMRPDVIYHASLNLREIIGRTSDNSFSVSDAWSNSDGTPTVDDVLYVSNSPTMDLAVKSVTDGLIDSNNSTCQTKFCKYLNDNNITINNLGIRYFSNKYTVMRQQCIHYCPITEFEKCAVMDKSIFYPSLKIEKKNMKIAICFSGQIRTGIQAAPNIKRFIGDLWDDCDFFIHTWDFESYKPFAQTVINGIPFPQQRQDHNISIEKIENFSSCYNPKKMIVEKFKNYKTINGTAINPIWYSTSDCFKLMSKYSTESGTQYDAVIKIRPDVIFGKNRRLKDEIDHYLINPSMLYSDCFIKGNMRLDDVFWVLNFENADKITALFGHITNKMKQLQDERLIILAFLKHNQIVNASTYRELYQYAIYRAESYMFDPMTQYTECFRNDWLHYSGISIEDYFKKVEEDILTGTYYD